MNIVLFLLSQNTRFAQIRIVLIETDSGTPKNHDYEGVSLWYDNFSLSLEKHTFTLVLPSIGE